jgi:Phasin protein
MSHKVRLTSPGAPYRSRDTFSVPPFAMWNPFFAQAPNGNAQAHECFATIASEWQEFVGRRLNEDVALMQRLAQSVTPDQVFAAYNDFWQQAAADYGNEFTTMSKLMTGWATQMAAGAQPGTHKASASVA